MPYVGFGERYMHEDIFEMAAAYLFHIVQNHPFIDGNKRTGAASAYIFLAMNNIMFDAAEDEFASMVLEVANGRMAKTGIAQYLRENSTGS
jgi:death-on-curing protein